MISERRGPHYSWILFDADGTLFDYDAAEAAALEASLGRIGQPFHPELLESYRSINGELWRDLERGRITQKRLRIERFERLFEAMGMRADPSLFATGYLGDLARRSELIEGVGETVEALSKIYRLMLITNGIAEVQRSRFSTSSIRDCFADLVISEEVGAAKPDPRIFDAAFAKMNQPEKSEVLIVGDSLSSDVQGGRDYGVDTCWFNPSGEVAHDGVQPTFEIARFDALRMLLRSR
jgi:2-haloacid dehalogenase